MQCLHHKVLCPQNASTGLCCNRPRVAYNHRYVCRASEDKSKSQSPLISEDVLARLKAAEEEAARLRKELQVAQAAKSGGVPDVIEAKPKRFDSVDDRETLFSGREKSSWLSEADVEFFTGAGRGEVGSPVAEDPEAQATVQRRLLIGGVLAIGVVAFGLIPTEKLRSKPPKPMYFYVVPILRIKDLLNDCQEIITNAEWDSLRLVISRIEGSPNKARENLDNIVACIEDTRTAEKAQKLSVELFEYLNAMDYNAYFDAVPRKVLTGAQNAEFVQFSSQALKAAQQRLKSFLDLLPPSAIADARATMVS